jgi:uncharacterized sulfatase
MRSNALRGYHRSSGRGIQGANRAERERAQGFVPQAGHERAPGRGRRKGFRLVFALVAAVVGFSAQAEDVRRPRATAQRPNVLFVYTDDQAMWSIGAYGRKDTRTPALDRLAREGVTFDAAFTTTPVCSPSRAGLMTGLYSTQVGIRDWLNPKAEPSAGLAPAIVVWPELLKAHGYATMLFGKWHLGIEDQYHPTRNGFDDFYGFRAGGVAPRNPELETEGETAVREGFLGDLITDRALRFIRENAGGTWLAAVHFREPHAPYAPTSDEDAAAMADVDIALPDVPGLPVERVRKLRREYLASVRSIDRNVGRLMALLAELKLDETTLVVFTSDHGYMIGEHGLHHKGNGSWIVQGRSGPRPNMFDDALRVPLIVRQPGRVPAGARVSRTVTQLDHFATILHWVGLKTPPNLKIEGRDASALFAGQAAPGWDDTYFGQYDMKHTREARMRMVRTPRAKLIRHFEDGSLDELYDLAADPGETKNLASDPAAAGLRQELETELRRRMHAIGDPAAAMP